MWLLYSCFLANFIFIYANEKCLIVSGTLLCESDSNRHKQVFIQLYAKNKVFSADNLIGQLYANDNGTFMFYKCDFDFDSDLYFRIISNCNSFQNYSHILPARIDTDPIPFRKNMYYLDDGIPKRYGRIFDMVEFIIINSDRWLYRVESEPDTDFNITDNCNTCLNSSFISSNNSVFDSSHDKIIREFPDPPIRRLNELYNYPFKINELP